MLDLAFQSIADVNPALNGALHRASLQAAQPMELLAISTLESHPHFRGRSQWIQIRYRDRCLYLSGKLPSFFLKQLAQESLRQLDGIDMIENRIVVACPQGQFDSRGSEL